MCAQIDLSKATFDWYMQSPYAKFGDHSRDELELIRLYLTRTYLGKCVSFSKVKLEEWRGKPSLRIVTSSEIRCGDMRTLLDTNLEYKGQSLMLFAIHACSEGERPEDWEEMREPGQTVQEWTFAWHELQYVVHPGPLEGAANDAKSIFS